MARVALSRRDIDGLCAVDFRRFSVVLIFWPYNSIGALYGNNLVNLYQLHPIYIRRNGVDQSLVTIMSWTAS